jgi:hypothetical protein
MFNFGGGFGPPGFQMVIHSALSNMMMGGGGGPMMQMLMRGGPPPSDKSQVGKEFDHYMRDAVTAQFPQSFREPTRRTTDVWADRGIVVTVVDPSDRSTVPDVMQTSAKIINLVQFNRTPFDAHTQWALEVKYDDPDMHKQMLGNSYVLNHRKSKKKKGKKKKQQQTRRQPRRVQTNGYSYFGSLPS